MLRLYKNCAGGPFMRTPNQQTFRFAIAAGFLAYAPFVSTASAEDAPRSYLASPDVYKVVANDGKTRVILATWRPGQRDQWHSHPPTGVYFLTDCEPRVHTPDGKFVDTSRKARSAVAQAAIPSHSFENRSSAECKVIIVERE
jgi:beta-alanine degradation protein BauB